MKVKLKPWQIGLIAAAGAVVLGGAGAGIYFGVNHAIDDAVNEKLNAALETTTDATTEPALDEPSTVIPTQTPSDEPESEKGTSVVPQTTKAPETVIVYVEPSTEKPITWELDPKLSREVSLVMEEKFSNSIYDETIYRDDIHPENNINPYTGDIDPANGRGIFVGNQNSPDDIAKAWTECCIENQFPPRKTYYSIQVYRFSNGYVAAYVCY